MISCILPGNQENDNDDTSDVNDDIPLSSLCSSPGGPRTIEEYLITKRSLGRQLPLNVNRNDLISPLLSRFKRRSYDINRPFDITIEPEITFTDEDGVDANGPKREFYFKLMTELSRSNSRFSIFEGEEDSKLPIHDNESCQNGLYEFVGMMVGYSIMHGGIGIPGMSPIIKQLIADPNREVGDLEISIECIPDLYIRDILNQVSFYCYYLLCH